MEVKACVQEWNIDSLKGSLFVCSKRGDTNLGVRLNDICKEYCCAETTGVTVLFICIEVRAKMELTEVSN